jgi:Zn-dependent protease with chaperone function
MTPMVIVLAAGGTLGVAAPLVLGRLGRLDRAPQTAAYLWLATTGGALSAVMLAGLLLIAGSGRLLIDLAVLLRTCSMALRAALGAPTGTRGPLIGLSLLALVAVGLLVGGVIACARAWRAAREHRELLTLAGHAQPGLPGVTVLEHPVPLAYCLPRRVGVRRGPVVVTTAALEQLDPGQLGAVLAHEHAHQTRRHHVLLLVAEALRIGFPWLPAARTAHHAISRLVELDADDAAAGRHDRAAVAAAVAKLAAAPAPTLGLGAGGATALERVRRLTSPTITKPGSAMWLASLLVAVPLLVQLLAVTTPLLSVAGMPNCPLP